MIEPLEVRIETWQDADLTGKPSGEPRKRLVCPYFPPHVNFSVDLLKSSKSLKVSKTELGPEIETSEGSFTVKDELHITCANGGATYLLGEEIDGAREAWLWRLTEGSERG